MLLHRTFRLMALILVAATAAMCSGCGRPQRFPLTTGAPFEFSAYYQNDISGSAKPILSAQRDFIRTIYPVWYEVDSAGNVTDIGYDQDAVRLADSAGTAVVPVVRNRMGGTEDPAALIRNSAAAGKAIDRLTDLARSRSFRGLNLDFSSLPADAGDQFLSFARDLWRAMHAIGKRLVITVPASPDRPGADTAAYDYRALSRVADFIILAAYDLHNDLTPPGPVAPLDWVQRSITLATGLIPAGKIILAVGAYGYDWPASGPGLNATVSSAGAYQLAQQVGEAVQFDPGAHEATFSYNQSGASRTVWFGERRSVAERVALARRLGLYGVVYWRLGQEEPGFWGVVQPAAAGR